MTKNRYWPALAGVLSLISCVDRDHWDPDELSRGVSVAEDKRLERGLASYAMYCSGCHGVEGDGEGPAARFLDPKPRDFRKGKVKFAGVAAGEMPTDADLVRTIARGLHGTSMPMWNLLPKEEVDDLVAYLKTFAPNRKPAGATVPIPADPWLKSPAKGTAEGERVYHGIAMCSSCHPAYATMPTVAEHMKSFDIAVTGFRDRMYEGETKDSEWGQPIKAPDFLRDRVKSGTAREDLVRVIAAGVGGTPMPSWGSALTPKQLWGLAYYVESLALLRGTKAAAALRTTLLEQPAFTPPPPPPPPAPEPPSAEPPPPEAK